MNQFLINMYLGYPLCIISGGRRSKKHYFFITVENVLRLQLRDIIGRNSVFPGQRRALGGVCECKSVHPADIRPDQQLRTQDVRRDVE